MRPPYKHVRATNKTHQLRGRWQKGNDLHCGCSSVLAVANQNLEDVSLIALSAYGIDGCRHRKRAGQPVSVSPREMDSTDSLKTSQRGKPVQARRRAQRRSGQGQRALGQNPRRVTCTAAVESRSWITRQESNSWTRHHKEVPLL